VIAFGPAFALVLLCNAPLLLGVASGARVIRAVEAKRGHSLDCNEAYEARKIERYFYPQRRWQGDAI